MLKGWFGYVDVDKNSYSVFISSENLISISGSNVYSIIFLIFCLKFPLNNMITLKIFKNVDEINMHWGLTINGITYNKDGGGGSESSFSD